MLPFSCIQIRHKPCISFKITNKQQTGFHLFSHLCCGPVSAAEDDNMQKVRDFCFIYFAKKRLSYHITNMDSSMLLSCWQLKYHSGWSSPKQQQQLENNRSLFPSRPLSLCIFWAICSEQQQRILGDAVWFKCDQSSRSYQGCQWENYQSIHTCTCIHLTDRQTHTHIHTNKVRHCVCASCMRATYTNLLLTLYLFLWSFFKNVWEVIKSQKDVSYHLQCTVYFRLLSIS